MFLSDDFEYDRNLSAWIKIYTAWLEFVCNKEQADFIGAQEVSRVQVYNNITMW